MGDQWIHDRSSPSLGDHALLLSHLAAENLRAQAQQVLAEQAQATASYTSRLESPDPFPFEVLPSGATVRPLPDGGKLFVLSEGSFLRFHHDSDFTFAAPEHGLALLKAVNGHLNLPDGQILRLQKEACATTHEAAGIEGLPWDVAPVRVAEARYVVVLEGDLRLVVCHQNRTVMVINPAGTLLLLSLPRIEAIGEKVVVQPLSDGTRHFQTTESNHGGSVLPDESIRLALAIGLNLVIRFPPKVPAGRPPLGLEPFLCPPTLTQDSMGIPV